MGAYGKLNLRAGVTINESWKVELFGTNITDVDDLVGAGPGANFVRHTPRQVGLEVGYKF